MNFSRGDELLCVRLWSAVRGEA